MKKVLKKLISQKYINYFGHLPLATLANLKYGFPSKSMDVVGVTGTDGKTTTTNMVYQILKTSGRKVALISTVKAIIGKKEYDTGFHVTTPEPFPLQKFIAEAKKIGCDSCVIETSSEGLDQFRVHGIKFKVGVITNITHEHLNYHKTFDNYLKAKARLIQNSQVVVLNKDEKHFEKLTKLTKGKVISFGLHKNADFYPRKFPLKLQIPGEYNILNALAAAASCSVLGVSSKVIRKALENFQGVEGRMRNIPNKLGIKIIVDFAHTPNGLENALKELRKQTKKRVIALSGAASERDETKRPIMGQILTKLADVVVLTDEDPRFEDSLKIINEMAAGAVEEGVVEGETLFKEPDRFKAIKMAIELAQKDDLVVLFGKGHEKSMNYRGVEKPWSDQKAVQKILAGIKVAG